MATLRNDAGLQATAALLARWQSARLLIEQNEQRHAAALQLSLVRLIAAAKSLHTPLFDPYSACDVSPRERHVQDFLYALLESSAPHRMAGHVLEMLLDEAARGSVAAKRRIDAFRKVRGTSSFKVEKEVALEGVRPDIVVSGVGIFIAIEIKRRLGVETVIGNEHQTTRLRRSTVAHAAALGIEEAGCLVLFMSPQGLRGRDPAVLPVKTGRLLENIERAFAHDKRAGAETKQLVTSFIALLTRD